MIIKTATIIANPTSEDIYNIIQRVVACLQQYEVKILFDERAASVLGLATHATVQDICSNSDMFIAIGGDGTLISAARFSGEKEIPILGIFSGRLGFMVETNVSEIEKNISGALTGTLPIHRRMRLECEIVDSNGQSVYKNDALNEVVINKGSTAKIIEFDVHVDGKKINHYRADGYIVSTPTGSTGYSLSAGGPIVDPCMNMMLLSPICSHALYSRTIIIPAVSEVQITVAETRQDIFVNQDGQVGLHLQPQQSLRIRRTSYDSLFYHVPERSFFDHLRKKFSWGQE